MSSFWNRSEVSSIFLFHNGLTSSCCSQTIALKELHSACPSLYYLFYTLGRQHSQQCLVLLLRQVLVRAVLFLLYLDKIVLGLSGLDCPYSVRTRLSLLYQDKIVLFWILSALTHLPDFRGWVWMVIIQHWCLDVCHLYLLTFTYLDFRGMISSSHFNIWLVSVNFWFWFWFSFWFRFFAVWCDIH